MRALAIILAFLCTAPAAIAAEIAIALTEDQIAIDTNFSGARLTLFGAVTGVDDPEQAIDIVAILRGPETQFQIRQYEKRKLIWAPGSAHIIEAAPGLYLTHATRAIADIAPLPDQAAYRLGADYLNLNVNASKDTPEQSARNALFRNAFLTEIEDMGFYRDMTGGIDFKKSGLFTVNVELPANTPVGDYDVSVFLYRDGILLGRDQASLAVNKIGLEQQIYELSRERPVSYGIVCVALSLFAGWIAAFAFRK